MANEAEMSKPNDLILDDLIGKKGGGSMYIQICMLNVTVFEPPSHSKVLINDMISMMRGDAIFSCSYCRKHRLLLLFH